MHRIAGGLLRGTRGGGDQITIQIAMLPEDVSKFQGDSTPIGVEIEAGRGGGNIKAQTGGVVAWVCAWGGWRQQGSAKYGGGQVGIVV